jgi:hypothetical protein
MSAPPVGWVRVSSTDPPLTITARLSDSRPDVQSGYGGWNEVTRPWRPPITSYQAPPPLHLVLPILLDGYAQGVSVERDIAQLQKMSTATASDGATPRVHIYATGSAVPYSDRTWVVGDLTWGDAEMDVRGNRTRQQLTLTLFEYVEDVYMTEKSAAKRRRNARKVPKTKSGASAKRVTAKHAKRTAAAPHTLALTASSTSTAQPGDGEDLLSIAARELGDADRWVEIAQLNGLRDPRSITPGQAIRLP